MYLCIYVRAVTMATTLLLSTASDPMCSGCNVVLMLLSRHAFKAQQQQMHSQHARQTNAYVKQGIRVSHSRHALRQKEQGRMQ